MLDSTDIQAELAAVGRPIEAARGLPSALYTSEDALALERKKIFFDGWAAIGLGKDVPKNGDAVPINFLGAPLFVIRDKDGELRVFENVCRHRGMILVSEPQNFGGVIRCPYHSWCYSTKGSLKATPHVGGPGVNKLESLDAETTGLNAVKTGVFMDIIFVNVSGTAESFEDYIAPTRERLKDFATQDLYPAADHSGFSLELKSNWKLIVENYCESYHVPWVHPGLAAYSRLEDHYHIMSDAGFAGQGTVVYNPSLHPTKKFPDFKDLPEKWDLGAEYIALFPNVFLSVHRDHYWTGLVLPKTFETTMERVDFYYATEQAASDAEYADIRAKNETLWKDILIEDIASCEGMQTGRHAPNFDGGVFSSIMDNPTHSFHQWAADRLGR